MIDIELIGRLDTGWQLPVKKALATLAESGIYELQMSQALAQLASGSVTETTEATATRVIAYRRLHALILAMKELGESLKKELDNA